MISHGFCGCEVGRPERGNLIVSRYECGCGKVPKANNVELSLTVPITALQVMAEFEVT